MRQFILVLIIIANSTSLWGMAAEDLVSFDEREVEASKEQTPENKNEVGVPILVNANNEGEAVGGFISVEPTQQRPDALSILRQEFLRQELQAQAQAKKDGVFWSTTKRFAPESITFFIAIGAVTFNAMWIKSHGDPLAMERHIMSLKDPIAHISFYAFMQSQGFYMDFHTNRAKFQNAHPAVRQQMLRRLSYQGMAVGSMASSIVADLGYSIKMCVNKWLKGHKDEQSLEICNQAWAQWTFRNKFTQYFPQIITMWAAQATTEMLERAAHMGFSKVSSTAWAKKILTKDFLVKGAYKITGADVVTTFVGGGWVTKSIKFVGKVTKFAGFVAVDHFISNYTYRPINNILKPMFFEWDALKINVLWAAADSVRWNSSDEKLVSSFEKEVENYGKQMQSWRDHLNMDTESDISGWFEMTKKLLNQIDFAYKFYQSFTDTLFEYIQTAYMINNKKLDPSARHVISGYPYRLIPFFGVKPGPYRVENGEINDLYILSPNELEMRQKEHVINTAKKFQVHVNKLHKKYDNQTFAQIINLLLSNDNLKMAQGLKEINDIIEMYRTTMRGKHPYSVYGHDMMRHIFDMKAEIGEADPMVHSFAGFAKAFNVFSPNVATLHDADFSKWSIKKNYRFKTESDLMFYYMVCGPEFGKLYKVSLAGVNFFSPQFEPPTLINKNVEKGSFCRTNTDSTNLYAAKINGMSMQDFIYKNINWSVIGDIRQAKNPVTFENWWKKNAQDTLYSDFKDYDDKFDTLFNKAYNNYFNHRGLYKRVVDSLNQSLYLPKSMERALKAETSFYLQILARSILPDSVTPPSLRNTDMPGADKQSFWDSLLEVVQHSPIVPLGGVVAPAKLHYPAAQNFNYLEYATKNAYERRYKPLYGQEPLEIFTLHYLFDQYHDFVRYRHLDFEKYIGHSKSIDRAINNALVALGLKRVVKGPSAYDDIESFSTPSISGTENSGTTYEDVPVANLSMKQRMGISAIKGLRLVESEIRRFIRMNSALSNSLNLENQELLMQFNQFKPKTQQNQYNPLFNRK